MTDGRFQGARFAGITDLESPVWRRHFDDLEAFSTRYLQQALNRDVWPRDYPWPFDSLHVNTRIWEYPFVADAFERFVPPGARVLDIGSALTFLPSWLAARGHSVVASDSDPRMRDWAARLHAAVSDPGLWPQAQLTYETLDVTAPALPDAAFDVITNVSVLEHLPPSALAAATAAIRRLLKPGGLLVCTCDLMVAGSPTPEHHPLNQQEASAFLEQLTAGFELAEPHRPTVPADLLTNRRYPRDLAARRVVPPWSAAGASGPRRAGARSVLRRIIWAALNRPSPVALEWCAYGLVLRKTPA